MKRILATILVVLLAVTVLSACSGGTTPSQSAANNGAPETTAAVTTEVTESGGQTAAASDIRIAVILKSLTNEAWMMAKYACEEKGEELGITVDVYSTVDETDLNEQVRLIEDCVSQGYNVIGVVPCDGTALVPAVEEAVSKGIPVICIDTSIKTDVVSSFVASDNVDGGRLAGEYIAEQLNGSGKVAVVRGGQGHTVELERYEGFTTALAGYPNIEIVAEDYANWQADQASNVMEDFLNAHPEIQAVFCESDMMGIGASQMAISSNRADIIIVSFDGTLDALNAVKEGTLSADIAQSQYDMGAYTVEAAYKLAMGETIDARIITPIVVATKDNVDPLIETWHSYGF